jgi:hypothetical protein
MGFNKIKDSEKYNPTKIDFYGNNNKKICSSDLSIFNSVKDIVFKKRCPRLFYGHNITRNGRDWLYR